MRASSIGRDFWFWWRPAFALDLRSLAVFRVALGIFLLVDLTSRLGDFSAHYSDQGVMSVESADDFSGAAILFPLHHIHHGDTWQQAVFLLGILLAIGIIAGLGTRFCLVGAWLLVNGIHARNPLVLYGADTHLVVMLLWSCFLPLDRCWSWTAWKSGRPETHRVQSVASVAYVLQIAVIYWFSFMSKSGEAWRSGEALKIALQLDAYVSEAGRFLASQTHWLGPLNWLTLIAEALAPILLLGPLRWMRVAAVGLIAGLQLGFAVFMDLGLFPYVSLVALIPLVWVGHDLAQGDKGKLAAQPSPWGPWSEYVAGILLMGMLLWNISVSQVAFQRTRLKARLSDAVVWVAEVFRLDQSWSMFSPDPPLEDGWLVVEARLGDGRTIDLLTSEPVSWEKPQSITQRLGGDRWKAYLLNLVQRNLSWKAVVRYWVREWERRNPDGPVLETVRVVLMQETYSTESLVEAQPLELYQSSRIDELQLPARPPHE